MNRDDKQSQIAYANAILKLIPMGFKTTDIWLFEKDGVVYDLSAANIDMIDQIVANKMCRFAYTTRAAAYLAGD